MRGTVPVLFRGGPALRALAGWSDSDTGTESTRPQLILVAVALINEAHDSLKKKRKNEAHDSAARAHRCLCLLIKPLPGTKPPLPQYNILGIAKRQNKEEEEHKWTEEEQNKKDKEQSHMEEEQRLKEEERAEIEAARKEYLKIVLSRMKLMRKVGRPATLMYCKNLDARELLSRKSNCDEIKWESG
jgi:type IV secretory pathway VirB10-like protein